MASKTNAIIASVSRRPNTIATQRTDFASDANSDKSIGVVAANVIKGPVVDKADTASMSAFSKPIPMAASRMATSAAGFSSGANLFATSAGQDARGGGDSYLSTSRLRRSPVSGRMPGVIIAPERANAPPGFDSCTDARECVHRLPKRVEPPPLPTTLATAPVALQSGSARFQALFTERAPRSHIGVLMHELPTT